MKRRPFLMASATLGAIFLFFLLLVLAVGRFTGRTSSLAIGPKVGVIQVGGAINSSREIIDQLLDLRRDGSVKSIVLRVDSPGGGVGPSQEIHKEVKRTAAIKPVVVSMGSVAASGGYYIAAPAQRILANPGTITGSIGVIMQFTNFEGLLDKVGLQNEIIKSGRFKDIGSSVRPMSQADRRLIQALIDDVHLQFISAVAEGRNMEAEEVSELADGRIFTGRQALNAGLVDELGNLQDAINAAAKLGGIEGEPKVVYPSAGKDRFFEYFIEEAASQLREGLREQTAGLQFMWAGID